MRTDLRVAVAALLGCAAITYHHTRRAAPAVAVVELPVDSVDLNRATVEELAALPGLGRERARRIVARRRELGRFRSVEELGSVPGFGPKTLERLRPALLVHDPGDPR